MPLAHPSAKFEVLGFGGLHANRIAVVGRVCRFYLLHDLEDIWLLRAETMKKN